MKEAMQNKIVLITGSTNGIGKQTALALARLGAQVIPTGRSRVSAEAAADEIKQAGGGRKVDFLLADLSTQAGLHSLVEQFKARYERLDVLIHNAGLAAPQRQLTEDGIESNFAVNVITPFLLTHLLMDRLKASQSARVISLTGGEAKGRIDLKNLQSERSFSGLNSYSHAKLAMMALMYEYARRVQGFNVTINVCYPGQASTDMTRGVTAKMLPGFMLFAYPLFKMMVRPDGGKSAARASRSSVYLASSQDVEGQNGKYFDSNCKLVNWPAAVLDSATRESVWSTVRRLARVTDN